MKLDSSAKIPASQVPRWRARLYWGAVSLVFLLFFLGCFHGVANYWQWGHNGFNGTTFSHAARNSIRFGIVPQNPYYTGIAPPGPKELYTDHPMMVHFHLIALHYLFGYAEWTGRLVPALYSFLSLVMLFLLLLRISGRAVALVATYIYALTPLNLIFANMIDHEQGAIFWCLVLLYAYCRWLETPRWRHTVLCLVSITMAAQFDWPGYYLAFLLALHALATGLKRHPGWFHWRPEYTWVSLFSTVVLANFVGFFLWIAFVRGGLEKMWHSFHWRAASQTGYLEVLFSRALDLRGIVLIGILGAWLLYTAWRVIRRKFGVIDLIPMLFLGTQLIHSCVFQQAGKIHSYWTYYLGPTLAVGGALVIMDAWRWLTRTLDKRFATEQGRLRWANPSLRACGMAFGAALLIIQAQFAWRQLNWGFSTGSASYVDNYDDQFAEIMWAQELSRHFERHSVHYLIHSSVRRWRLEFTYYLDAPKNHQPSLAIPHRIRQQVKHPVLLVDLNHLPDRTGSIETLAQLVGQYRTLVWDRRFIAIDAGGQSGEVVAHVSRQEPASIWWRWLVNPNRPPVRWIPDPAPQAVASLFARGPALFRSRQHGGRGGGKFEWMCTSGQVLDKLSGQTADTPTHPLVSAVHPECHTVLLRDRPDRLLSPTVGPWLGRVSSASSRTIGCKAGELPVGIFGHSGALLDGLGLLCAHTPTSPDTHRTEMIGNPGGSRFEERCSPGTVLFGLTGRSSKHIHAIGIICSDYSKPPPTANAEPGL